jgi:hypothetical protein
LGASPQAAWAWTVLAVRSEARPAENRMASVVMSRVMRMEAEDGEASVGGSAMAIRWGAESSRGREKFRGSSVESAAVLEGCADE